MKRYKDIAGDGGSNIAQQVGEQQARLQARLAEVRAVVAVVSGKGGVGKSSITANLAACWALEGRRVGVLDADLNGPTMATMLGVRGRRLVVGADGVTPPESALGIRVMSMDLLLPSDDTPLVWEAPTQAESHTWRGAMEANALREFLADTAWGELDLLLLDLPPGAERTLQAAEWFGPQVAFVLVTIPSDLSRGVVSRSLAALRKTRNPVLGYVENMAGYWCADCGEVKPLFPAASEVELGGLPCLGRIPFDPELAARCDRGESLEEAAAAAPALAALASRIGFMLQGLAVEDRA